MNLPTDLSYSKSHEWIKLLDGGKAVVGLTDFAQSEMGDIVFVNLPSVGDTFSAGDTLADVESVKAVSDVFCPASGTVSKINETLLDAPETVNADPYGAWFVELEDVTATEELLTAEEYRDFCEKEGH